MDSGVQIQDNNVDLTAHSAPYPDTVLERAALVAVVPPEATASISWCADPKYVVDLTAYSGSVLGVRIRDVGSHPVVQKLAALVMQWLDYILAPGVNLCFV